MKAGSRQDSAPRKEFPASIETERLRPGLEAVLHIPPRPTLSEIKTEEPEIRH